ncbi:MAG: lamin tail domain-containing protein [Dehalococcoidia bacterium]
MKNGAIRYLISFTVLIFLTLSLAMACAQSNTSPPPTPPEPPPAQPPAVSENQTPEEPPPVSEAIAATSSPIEITYIRYKGTVYLPDPENCLCYKRIEPDEYVVIKNLSETSVKMGGWVLKNITKGYPSFTFPPYFVFGPGQIIRVYTDEIYPECGAWLEFGGDSKAPYCENPGKIWFSFNWGVGDIWSNEKPNIAVLYNARGNEVSRKSYVVPMEMNEVASE